jgi:pimeloyl-ACP methyl ester carboxylesterase
MLLIVPADSDQSIDMTDRQRIWIEREGVRIALSRWGEADRNKPPLLLVHGTGFVSEIWDEVATALASGHNVYALDRRGHGASDKPAGDKYHFQDFALDVCAVTEALDLSDVFGVGHSAGATDLLLAARLAPGRFSRLFVMEPTVMDARGKQSNGLQLSDESRTFLRRALCRRSTFESAAAARQRLRAVPVFADWSEPALRAYVQHGFEPLQDGRVRLLCTPEIEAAMLRPIFEAMEQVYAGDERGNPFHWLPEIACPVCVSTAERSDSIYKEMASRAVGIIPAVSQWTFEGVGHCVAQEAPALVLGAIEAFKAGAG